MEAHELEREDDPDIAHQAMRDPDCKCDRCDSMRACEPITLPMEQCEACGGRATLPPTCLSCTAELLEQLAELAGRAVKLGGRSNLYGTDLATLLKLRKAQLPAGSEKLTFWRHCRPRQRS